MPEEKEPFNPNVIFERRKFVRVDGTFVVSYRDITSAEAKTNITQTRNISAGGIMFTTDEGFPEGAVLSLSLRLPGKVDHINVKIQVVGSSKTGKGFSHVTRGKFINLKEEDRESIRKIVEYNLGQG
jgi:c-di-GMP-binding flagellar brake protein YcgR